MISLWIKKIRRKFKDNVRHEPRLRVKEGVVCQVRLYSDRDCTRVFICNLSKTGMGFLVNGHELKIEIGHKLDLIIFKHGEKIFQTLSDVVGQDVYYPPGISDFKKALFRFSIRFKDPVDEDTISQLIAV